MEHQIVTKQFNNQEISFDLSGHGMINATQIAKAGNKLITDYFRSKESEAFMEELSSVMGIPITDLKVVKQGGTAQGTWVHRRLAIDIARWSSTKLAIQINEWIEELFIKGHVSINSNNGIERLITIIEQDRIESKAMMKSIMDLASNMTAMLNNLAIKHEPKTETPKYFQPSFSNNSNEDIHLYHRITIYGKKFRPDLDQSQIRDRAKEIGMMASRLSKERNIQIIKEDNLDGRFQNKISYYHQNVLKEVFDLIF
jgi:hypothetical protein